MTSLSPYLYRLYVVFISWACRARSANSQSNSSCESFHLAMKTPAIRYLLKWRCIICINCINQLYNKRGVQFNARLLLWQPSGMFSYSTVIILICFMLFGRIKYDDDDDDDEPNIKCRVALAQNRQKNSLHIVHYTLWGKNCTILFLQHFCQIS